MLEDVIQQMIQYSHTDAIEDNLEDDRRCLSTQKGRILHKMIQLRLMMKMKDDVPKLPMTYRDSLESCTVVVAVVVVVEYLPS